MDTTTATVTTKCNRCGRALRSEKSVKAGYGPTCKAKVAQAAKAIAETAVYKEFQMTKAVEVVELAAIVRTARAAFQVVSSNGHDVYLIDQTAHTCSCPAGEHGRICYHLAAADILAAA